LILRGGADLCQKRLDVGPAKLPGMAKTVERDVLPDPSGIRFAGSRTVMKPL
jgi:hypothetical protein